MRTITSKLFFVNLVFAGLGSSLLRWLTSQKMALFCGFSKVTLAHSAYIINTTGTVFFKVFICKVGTDSLQFRGATSINLFLFQFNGSLQNIYLK